MNPQTCSSAWGAQHVFLEAPTSDSAARRALDDWASNQSPGERRDIARIRILQSHSDRLDLSSLGLTELPPLPMDRGWKYIDLSHNPLQIPTRLTLPAGATQELGGNPQFPSSVTGRDPADGARRAPKRPVEAHHTAGFRHTWRAPADTAETFARRLALHLGHKMSLNEVILQTDLDSSKKCALLAWIEDRRPYLAATLKRNPKRDGETNRCYAARLISADPTLDAADLRALTKCHPSDIQKLLLSGAAPTP